MDVFIKYVTTILDYATNDKFTFPIMESIYIVLFLYAICKDYRARHTRGAIRASVRRGNVSMSMLHGVYVSLALIIFLLTLNVGIIKERRIFFALLNLSLLAYLCFYNAWFRNMILGWIGRAFRLEE